MHAIMQEKATRNNRYTYMYWHLPAPFNAHKRTRLSNSGRWQSASVEILPRSPGAAPDWLLTSGAAVAGRARAMGWGTRDATPTTQRVSETPPLLDSVSSRVVRARPARVSFVYPRKPLCARSDSPSFAPASWSSVSLAADSVSGTSDCRYVCTFAAPGAVRCGKSYAAVRLRPCVRPRGRVQDIEPRASTSSNIRLGLE